jgi:hypothetical protein
MSGRIGANPVRSPYDEVYLVAGSIYGGGTAPTARLMKGCTFARGGTGAYIIYPDVNLPFLAAQTWETISGAGNTYKETGSTYYSGATTGFTGHTAGATCYASCILTVAGTATDMPAGDELHFIQVWLRTTKP